MKNNDARRAPRQPFEVDVEIINIESGTRITERTKDVNLYGCAVRTSEPFAAGTRVVLNFTHANEKITATGRVMYGRPDLGMGIAFAAIESEDQKILERWLGELAGQ